MTVKRQSYGQKKQVYVQIAGLEEDKLKILWVHGRTFDEVLRVVDKSLTAAFGRDGKGPPKERRARTRVY